MVKYIFIFIYCFSGYLHAQQTEGSGIVSYPDNNVKVVGEKIFWSANPVTDNSNDADLLTVYYKGLYNRRNNYLNGIKGIIDKPGGYIKIQVYAYDSKRPEGLQLVRIDRESYELRPVYEAEITQSSSTTFSKIPKNLVFHYYDPVDDWLRSYGIPSDDIKTLGAQSLNAFTMNCGGWAWSWLRTFGLVNSSCSKEIDKDVLVNLENQQVVVKISIKDATLIDVRVPAVETNDDLKSIIIQKEYPYLIINKVNVEVIEAPGDNNTAYFYEDMIRKAFDWNSKVYAAKTELVLSETAINSGVKLANARVIFKDIDIFIRKGSTKSYDLDEIMEEGKDAEIDLRTVNNGELSIKLVKGLIRSNTHFMGYTILKESTSFKKGMVLLSYDESRSQVISVLNTVPHELGHYFGLLHTFQGGCADKANDGISDTPPAEELRGTIPDYKNCIAPIQCDGKRRLIENIMDYSGDCGFMFTPGQVKVIRNTIRIDSPDLYTVTMAVDRKINIVPNFAVRDLRPAKTTRRSTIEDESEKYRSISIYPNPVKDKLNIANVENEEYVIFSINGQQILSGRTQKGQIDVSALSGGMYIIKIKNTNKRFIKE